MSRAPASRRWRTIAIAGTLAAAAATIAGVALEVWLLGWSEADLRGRVEHQVREAIDQSAVSLQAAATRLAGRGEMLRRAASDERAAPALFVEVERAVQAASAEDVALTVYNATGGAVAWAGRPSDLPRPLLTDRLKGSGSLFVAPGPLGLRLVYLQPVSDALAAPAQVGLVAAERVISPTRGVDAALNESYQFHTPLADVGLRMRYEGAGGAPIANAFPIRAPSGELLLEAHIPPHELERTRTEFRRSMAGVVLAIAAITLLMLVGPALDIRARTSTVSRYLQSTVIVALLLIAARALLWLATPARWSGRLLFSPSAYASSIVGPLLRAPIDFIVTGLVLLALVAVAADGVQRLRYCWRRQKTALSVWQLAMVQLTAGALAAALVLGYELFLGDTVDNTSVDILHFSLHPPDSARLALMVGLLAFHAAVFWALTAVLLAGRSVWHIGAGWGANLMLFVLWSLPSLAIVAIAVRSRWAVPTGPALLIVATAVATAYTSRRWRAWVRHSAQASRLLAFFLAMILPAVVVYPSLLYFADRAKARLIESQYAVQAATHPQELNAKLRESLAQIDRIPALADTIHSLEAAAGGPPQTDAAFFVWRQTDLAQFRLTSAIELYGPRGSLLSRFALNFPEYAPGELRHLTQTEGRADSVEGDPEPVSGPGNGQGGPLARNGEIAPVDLRPQAVRCEWDLFGEATPFGFEERRMLHAERDICKGGQAVGAIVVHVMLDYDTLPFISSQSPYFEFFRDAELPPQEGTPGRDVELVIYGWGRLPLYTSAPAAWTLDEAIFDRVQSSRQPFWTTLERGDTRYRVYLANDRYGIYALGYPALSWFDHFVTLSELSFLAGAVFLIMVLGGVLFLRVARERGGSVRHLVREFRESFYRKLSAMFVVAAVVPVVILAFAVRAYVERLIRVDIESEAARTAAVAQRVVEESAVLQRGGGESLATVSDDVMVATSELIDQDVNLFSGSRLIATSERDLFASGLLPTRTPAAVYRGIVLQHLPSLVTDDRIGSFPYLLAAAPVRVGGGDAILTVPLTLRQQQIDRDIDELNRGLYFAALAFILLGATFGFRMAERIADPVSRLTRATRRIAEGDLDARLLVRSADELQRLVEAFNRMAGELKEQRRQLERTHRLEAWAEMARQVAHEIKNPLTPIQLSAEHLRRVHADKGKPLSPVLEGCVDAILTQVALLRQIAAEFSSFASSPTARPAVTSIPDVVTEVIEPYRVGLAGRIEIDLQVVPDLPSVYVDRTLIARALANIVENALHAMPGQGVLRVTVQPDADRSHVAITVADSGVGMDADALARVFEPYFSTKTSGTGLGLTIARRNIELNGGSVEIDSAKGAGTTVRVRLPAYLS